MSACCGPAARPRTASSRSPVRSTSSNGWASLRARLRSDPAGSPIPGGGVGKSSAQVELGDDPEPIAQPIDVADKPRGGQLDVPPPGQGQGPPDHARQEIAPDRG